MTDLVERLRKAAGSCDIYGLHEALEHEAADEIERLRAEFELFREAPSKLEAAQYEIERLRAAVVVADRVIKSAHSDCDDMRAEIRRLRSGHGETR